MQIENFGSQREQYIVFQLAKKKFGVSITQTREIISAKELTYVPDSPDFVKGIINLRGAVVPVIDLHLRLDIEADKGQQSQKIIIIELDSLTAGMLVDDVEEIKGLMKEEISILPKIAKKIDSNYIEGVARTEDEEELLLLLDLNNVLTKQQKETLRSVEEESTAQEVQN